MTKRPESVPASREKEGGEDKEGDKAEEGDRAEEREGDEGNEGEKAESSRSISASTCKGPCSRSVVYTASCGLAGGNWVRRRAKAFSRAAFFGRGEWAEEAGLGEEKSCLATEAEEAEAEREGPVAGKEGSSV